MLQLSPERLQQILHEETLKAEDTKTLLRSIYSRYMRLFERYFADVDALNDDLIAQPRKDHEETRSLIKYYYLDIPQDTSDRLKEFDEKCVDSMLGKNWNAALFLAYAEFKDACDDQDKSEEYYKAGFVKRSLAEFYEAMDYVFRSGYGSDSETGKDVWSGIKLLLFGKDKK